MKIRTSTSMACSPLCLSWLAVQLFWMLSAGYGNAVAAQPLFDAPVAATSADEIVLVSTRAIGTVCSSEKMSKGLVCQRYVAGRNGTLEWHKSDWRTLLSAEDDRPTIVYVHGNRVGPGKDRIQGLQVYKSFKKNTNIGSPVRFIIWSWPATKIPRPVKDYRVKAIRTTPAAWQLAWFLDKLPVDHPISLVGYSYGTRIVTGAMHILAGGKLGTLRLKEQLNPQRPPVRVALIAAAYDADWIEPKNYYGRAIAQIEQMVIATNEHDPAMHYYHLSTGRKHMDALGRSGVHKPSRLGTDMLRLRLVDFSREVGRSHAVTDYLAVDAKMGQLWRQIVLPQEQLNDSDDPLDRDYWSLSTAIQASRNK